MQAEKVGNEYSLLVFGAPKSVNAKSKKSKRALRGYKKKVANLAKSIFRNLLSSETKVQIYHFHKGTTVDLNNISKPIIDSLIGIAYNDDNTVGDIRLIRINLNNPRTIRNITSPLIPEAIARSRECVVIIIKPLE